MKSQSDSVVFKYIIALILFLGPVAMWYKFYIENLLNYGVMTVLIFITVVAWFGAIITAKF
jgi:hypothetical protein